MEASESQRPSDRAPAACIEPMAPTHIPDLVRLHELCYPSQFATRLGGGVLAIVYRGYCEDANAVGLVSIAEGRVVASVCGVIGAGFKHRLLRRHGLALMWQLLRRIVSGPTVLGEIACRLRAAFRRQPAGMAGPHPRRFVWRSQAVHPQWRGHGTIFPLVNAMLATLRERGVTEIYSLPDEDNLASVWIHRVLRFQQVGERTGEDGRQHPVFILRLDALRPRNSASYAGAAGGPREDTRCAQGS